MNIDDPTHSQEQQDDDLGDSKADEGMEEADWKKEKGVNGQG